MAEKKAYKIDFKKIKEIDFRDYLEDLGYKAESNKKHKAVYYKLNSDGKKEDIIGLVDAKGDGLGMIFNNMENPTEKGDIITFTANRINGYDPTAYLDKNRLFEAGKMLQERYLKQGNIAFFKHKEKDRKTTKSIFDPKGITKEKNNQYLYERGLTDKTIKSDLFKGKIMYQKYKDNINVCFPFVGSNSNKMVGLEKQYKQKGKNFKLFEAGSDKSNGLWISNMPQKINEVMVFESVIDALSHYELYAKKNTLYIATGGTPTQNQIKRIQKATEHYNAKLVSGCDKDFAGEIFSLKMSEKKDGKFSLEYDMKTKTGTIHIKDNELLTQLSNQLHLRKFFDKAGKMQLNQKNIEGLTFSLEKAKQVYRERPKTKDFNQDLKKKLNSQLKPLNYEKSR